MLTTWLAWPQLHYAHEAETVQTLKQAIGNDVVCMVDDLVVLKVGASQSGTDLLNAY